MNELFIVARNPFTISVSEGVTAWRQLRPRFLPFSAEDTHSLTLLKIDIQEGELKECEAEKIYEPVYGGIGEITAHASLTPAGEIVMEFRHIEENGSRLRLTMTREVDAAEILIHPAGDSNDMNILSHALMIAFMMATAARGTLVIHASGVVSEGKAYLFQGKSGTGKSTHAALWVRHIPGAELLNDDNPMIRFSESGEAMAYGSPWSGKTPCYRNVEIPLGGIVRIVRDRENFLQPLKPLQAYASLTSSIYYLPLFSEKMRSERHKQIERLAMSIPCYEMHCLPDADAARVCHAGL